MSTLVVDRLDDESTVLIQPLVLERDITLTAIRPFLYFNNMPAGNFSLSIVNSDGETVRSYPFTSAQAKAAVSPALGINDNYFWVYLSLAGECRLGRGEYELRLEATGYAFSDSSFISWVKDWQQLKDKTIGTPNYFSEHPYSFTLIEYAAREY